MPVSSPALLLSVSRVHVTDQHRRVARMIELIAELYEPRSERGMVDLKVSEVAARVQSLAE